MSPYPRTIRAVSIKIRREAETSNRKVKTWIVTCHDILSGYFESYRGAHTHTQHVCGCNPYSFSLPLYCVLYLCGFECRFEVQNVIMTFYVREGDIFAVQTSRPPARRAFTILAKMWGHPRAEFLHVKNVATRYSRHPHASLTYPPIFAEVSPGSSENPFLPGRRKNRYET